ncbi:MAG: hypothetical protein WEA58_10175 [Balneolaceae bacterium]
MKFKTYIVARDYGFSPNPFGEYCTLSCCKPRIRRNVNVGDWVFGTGSKKYNIAGKLVFAMNVSERLTFQEYWDDPRFEYKKPIMNGSLVQMYGDNIYYRDSNTKNWNQENSHHSLPNGTVNGHNLERDIRGKFVLVSKNFYFFGKSAIEIPIRFKTQVCTSTQGHKNVDNNVANKFLNWLSKNYQEGRHDDPILFDNSFKRYDGVS